MRVGLRIENDRLVQFEQVRAFVSIYNDSDYPFVFFNEEEEGNSWIEFVISGDHNRYVRRTVKSPMVAELRVLPEEKSSIMVDVSRWYDLTSMCGYNIAAAVVWKGIRFQSNSRRIEIVRGLPITSIARPAPGAMGSFRTYDLRYLSRRRMEHLFISIDNRSTGVNYGVYDLGRLIRVVRPTIEVKRTGAVTVFHQSGKDKWTRSFLSVSGDQTRFVDQTYHYGDGRPYGSENAGGEPETP